jgi:hypothetical protein
MRSAGTTTTCDGGTRDLGEVGAAVAACLRRAKCLDQAGNAFEAMRLQQLPGARAQLVDRQRLWIDVHGAIHLAEELARRATGRDPSAQRE